MMKSKKLVLVFGLVIAMLLLVIVPSVQATDDNSFANYQWTK